jgi:hypothetical protein
MKKVEARYAPRTGVPRSTSMPSCARDDPPRALSLVQPEASLVAAGMMRTIRRSIGTDYRGRLHIYASILYNRFNRAVCNAEPYRSALRFLGYGHGTLPLMRLVGHAALGGCLCLNPDDDSEEMIDAGPYKLYYGHNFRRLYDWHFTDSRFLDAPIAIPEEPGELPGLFRIDPEIAAWVFAAACPRGTGIDLGPPRGTVLEYGSRLVQDVK